jgi:hypothetical protein
MYMSGTYPTCGGAAICIYQVASLDCVDSCFHQNLLHLLSSSMLVEIGEALHGALLCTDSSSSRVPWRRAALNGTGTPCLYIYNFYNPNSDVGVQHEKYKFTSTELMARTPTTHGHTTNTVPTRTGKQMWKIDALPRAKNRGLLIHIT